jgi:hypothetical protein
MAVVKSDAMLQHEKHIAEVVANNPKMVDGKMRKTDMSILGIDAAEVFGYVAAVIVLVSAAMAL